MGPADSIALERAACVDWISRVLADGHVASNMPMPPSKQMDSVAWAMLASYHRTLTTVRPDLIPQMGPLVLKYMSESRSLESAGMLHYPQVSKAMHPPTRMTKAQAFLASLGMAGLTVVIFLGIFCVFLIAVGVIHAVV